MPSSAAGGWDRESTRRSAKAGDLTLNYTTYTDDYTWDIPA